MSELSYLRGSPILALDDIYVYPTTLSEIEQIGFESYNSFINILCVNKETLLKSYQLTHQEMSEYLKADYFELLMSFIEHMVDLKSIIINSLSLFLREEIYFDSEEKLLFINRNDEKLYIVEELLNKIKSVILKQNYMENTKDDPQKFNPENDKARELIEKMKQVKNKLKKQNNEEGLNLSDIISIVATYSNDINILTVWNLTIYQLYESYLRLVMWDEYHNNFLLLPHVSDNKSLNLKHWATKIDKK
jgi:hypothetical protein